MSRLHNVAEQGDLIAVRECLASGMDVNALGFHGTTPLQNAANGGFPKVVSELLQAGADPNLTGKGSTPLQKAASNGHLAVVKLLVEAGAELNSTQGGYPAINMAAMFGHSKVVAYLREQGASLDLPDSQGKTATDWLAIGGIEGDFAQKFGHLDFSVAKPHDTDAVRRMMADCATPEEYAAQKGRYIAVFGYGVKTFEDKTVEEWAHRLWEILQDSNLLAECEEQFLTGDALEEARKVRARKVKAQARWQRQQAIKAARMQNDEE